MAVLYARANYARSNATRSGYYQHAPSIKIAGTTRIVDMDELHIEEYLDGTPNTLSIRIYPRGAFIPTAGQEIQIFNGGASGVGVPIFGGHIMQVEQEGYNQTQKPTYRLLCQDYNWLLDRYTKINHRYFSQGVNTIAQHIVANYTDGGFKIGSIPSSLGNVATDMTFESVRGAFDRLAKACNAYWTVGYDKYISIGANFNDGNTLTVANNATGYSDFRYTSDLSQIRTRLLYEGGGSNTSSLVSAGATVIPVDECSWYSTGGGTIRANYQTCTYTGKSVGSGAGNLTGVSGVVYDIPSGEAINVFVQSDDSAAQTALATILGGGLSGIVSHYVQDGRLSLTEATARASTELSLLSTSLKESSFKAFGTATLNQFMRVGKSVTFSLTLPNTISASLVVQQVTITVRTKMVSGTIGLGLQRQVQCSPFRRGLETVLRESA